MNDNLILVQFCPCGDTSYMTHGEILQLGGANQLDLIDSGQKLDAPTFHSSDCPSCQAITEEAEADWSENDSDVTPDPNPMAGSILLWEQPTVMNTENWRLVSTNTTFAVWQSKHPEARGWKLSWAPDEFPRLDNPLCYDIILPGLRSSEVKGLFVPEGSDVEAVSQALEAQYCGRREVRFNLNLPTV